MKRKAIREFEDDFLKELIKRIEDEDIKEYSDFATKHIKDYLRLSLEHAHKGKLDLDKLGKKFDEVDGKTVAEVSFFGVKPFDPDNEDVKNVRRKWMKVILDYYLRLLEAEVADELNYKNLVKSAFEKRELEKIFLKRIEFERKMFHLLIENSHPLLFFKREYMRNKLNKFVDISVGLHKEKVEELFGS